ncbi:DUF1614 domain-containing protein [Methanoculleus sp. FWC-SCC1]|uniref:DUF1614 domain-containing protein n=1 Tax=Methanoculleus frigidifontis TaxID=2584085 RepID=A0ABT8ME52_9EURY|nr:DUF1614 domain-containing protein [Methanoculleus sp. FWC-SCC1]
MENSLSTVAILPFPASQEQIILALIVIVPLLLIFSFLLISEEAFEAIGFRFHQAVLMTVGALVGSFINIPLIPLDGAVIAVNVGGCIIPLFITLELAVRRRVNRYHALAAIAAVSLITFAFATPVPGVGITMPFYIAPLAGAGAGLLLARGCGTAPMLAYAGGTVGTLMGADIFNLANPAVLASLTAVAGTTLSIGGAGIFDGIFITGILAVALAAYFGRRIRKMKIACPQDSETESG